MLLVTLSGLAGILTVNIVCIIIAVSYTIKLFFIILHIVISINLNRYVLQK